MSQNPSYARKPSKWFSRPHDERRAIVRKFWESYFRDYPEYGCNPEVNMARAIIERGDKLPNSFLAVY
jgi:hypothetical protein